MAETFSTYWLIDGQRVEDFDEVKRLVDAGHVAREVSAEEQEHRHRLLQELEAVHARNVARYEKAVAEAAFRESPAGLRAAAIQTAAANPGGIVSGGHHPVHDELGRYSPDNTNPFK